MLRLFPGVLITIVVLLSKKNWRELLSKFKDYEIELHIIGSGVPSKELLKQFDQTNIIYRGFVENLMEDKVKLHFKDIVKGNVKRYTLDNLLGLNFILEDSLGGGGSESLLNDAQGKTYGQAMLLMEISIPKKFEKFINE